MATATAAEKREDIARAREILDNYAPQIIDTSGLVIISQEIGKGLTDYLRVSLVSQDSENRARLSHLTWAIAKVFGYTLRDRSGYWFIAMGGGNYSKPDAIARDLANYYKIDRVRYEQN